MSATAVSEETLVVSSTSSLSSTDMMEMMVETKRTNEDEATMMEETQPPPNRVVMNDVTANEIAKSATRNDSDCNNNAVVESSAALDPNRTNDSSRNDDVTTDETTTAVSTPDESDHHTNTALVVVVESSTSSAMEDDPNSTSETSPTTTTRVLRSRANMASTTGADATKPPQREKRSAAVAASLQITEQYAPIRTPTSKTAVTITTTKEQKKPVQKANKTSTIKKVKLPHEKQKQKQPFLQKNNNASSISNSEKRLRVSFTSTPSAPAVISRVDKEVKTTKKATTSSNNDTGREKQKQQIQSKKQKRSDNHNRTVSPSPPTTVIASASSSLNNNTSSTKSKSLQPQQQQLPSTLSFMLKQLNDCPTTATNRRSSCRNQEYCLFELAKSIVLQQRQNEHTNQGNQQQTQRNNIVIITGAGLSVDSGIRPFRTNPVKAGSVELYNNKDDTTNHPPDNSNNNSKNTGTKHYLQEGLWNDIIWTTATRESFRKNPERWYNEFWVPYFCTGGPYSPNIGHASLQALLNLYPSTVKHITQNIDGLSSPVIHNHDVNHPQLIEVHGRCGLFKCCPSVEEEEQDEENNETDSNLKNVSSGDDNDGNDSDDDRKVHLGHRRSCKRKREQLKDPRKCPYQYLQSLTAEQVEFQLMDPERKEELLQQQRNNNSSNHMYCSNMVTRTKAKTGGAATITSPDVDDRKNNLGNDCESNGRNNNKSDSKSTNGRQEEDQQQSVDETKTMEKSNVSDDNDDLKKNDTNGTANSMLVIQKIPTCPFCGNIAMPQALLFDEGYHSHSYYNSELCEDWLEKADVIVFIGTSFAVRLTQVALQHARDNNIPVYNFNLQHDTLESTVRLNASNIVGPVSVTLPKLLLYVREIQKHNATVERMKLYRQLTESALLKFDEYKQKEQQRQQDQLQIRRQQQEQLMRRQQRKEWQRNERRRQRKERQQQQQSLKDIRIVQEQHHYHRKMIKDVLNNTATPQPCIVHPGKQYYY